MITLCIRYTIDPTKLNEFAAYATALPKPIARSGGALTGFYLPTKLAGPTNVALALIDFPDLAAYEAYRAKLDADPENADSVRRRDSSCCVLNEDRSFMSRVSA